MGWYRYGSAAFLYADWNLSGALGKLWIVVYDWGSKFDLAARGQWRGDFMALGANGTVVPYTRNITIFGIQNLTSTIVMINVENLTSQ